MTINRRTRNLFDALFHRLADLSDTALITFVNALFTTDYPPDTPVDRLTTSQHDGHQPRYPDLILRIRGTVFHIEAQTSRNGQLAMRVFSYGYHEAIRHRRHDRHGVTILPFPQARIIYLEGSTRSPDLETLRLIFPDGTHHDYPVQSFAIAKHDPAGLDALGLDVLLPFSPLALRRGLDHADTAERSRRAHQLADLVEHMLDAIRHGHDAGRLTPEDEDLLVDLADELVSQVYIEPYDEFKEANPMPTLIKTRVERAHDEGLQQGLAQIQTRVERAHDEGLQQGLAQAQTRVERAHDEGLEQGHEDGRRDALNTVARSLLASGLAVDDIARHTGLTPEEIRALA